MQSKPQNSSNDKDPPLQQAAHVGNKTDNRSDNQSDKQSNKQSNNKKRLTAVLEEIEPNNTTGRVSVGDIMKSLDSRGFGPLLFAPALIAVMPTGGIPGVPTVCGVVIALLSVQMLFGKEHPWFPKFIDKIDFEKDKLEKGVSFVKKITKKIDTVTHPRVDKLSKKTAKKIIALICIVSALAMIPLELVPFAVIIPAMSIMLLSIGLITKDGYVIIAAFLLNLGTFYFLFTKALDML